MVWGIRNRWDPQEYLRERHGDVRVVTMELPDRLQGCVDPVRRIIWLNDGLAAVERRCCLAYEIGQLELGPVPADPRLGLLYQRTAADWAARMLISVDELVSAFRLFSTYADAARFLDVDVPTLRARLRGMSDQEQDDVLAAIQERLAQTA